MQSYFRNSRANVVIPNCDLRNLEKRLENSYYKFYFVCQGKIDSVA